MRVLVAGVLTALGVASSAAVDQPVPGRKLTLIAHGRTEKLDFVTRAKVVLPGRNGAADPTLVGATVAISNPDTGDAYVFDLPRGRWKASRAGKWFRYRDPRLAEPGRVRIALVTGSGLEVSTRRTGIPMTAAPQHGLTVV